MLYPHRQEKKLTKPLFENPSSEYRGAPFWAWNCHLDQNTVEDQVEMLKAMGMGGYHIHVRTGMATHYLSDEFMALVKAALDKGKQLGMLTWLYDEDRWPSGTAGGLVTRQHPEYRIRYLVFSPEPFDPDKKKPGSIIGIVPFTLENGEPLATYAVKLNKDGTLADYRLCEADEAVDGNKWYATIVEASNSPWYNNSTYLDTMNTKAVEEFARTTYDRYAELYRQDFGEAIPAIFTDEPQFIRKSTLSAPDDKADVFLAWTPDFADSFQAAYSQDIVAGLPELIWDLPGGEASTLRYHYHDHASERFTSAFCDTLGAWCAKRNLLFTGHLMFEETLWTQTTGVGEAMRSYRAFSLPGIDMLCDWHEYNTAKQCQSAVRQQGAEGMMSELYGGTGWDNDFRMHKIQGDWQAAMGVTVRVHHITWMSMKGEAKRDYPASIGYQSPWFEQYSLVEDHFARVATAMTRGRSVVKIGVIHPIESYWLHWGPATQTAAARQQLEDNFANLTETLLFNLLDFDFICESRLPQLCENGGNPLQVGEMAYDVVVVPACQTLRATTLTRLHDFKRAGGRLLFLGDCPRYVDAVKSCAVSSLYDAAEAIPFDTVSVLQALEQYRFLDIRRNDGPRSDCLRVDSLRTDYLLHQLRQDGDNLWLFIARGKDPITHDVDDAPVLCFTLNGEYTLAIYDTQTGEILDFPAEYRDGDTVFLRQWHLHDSLLLRLSHGRGAALALLAEKQPEYEPQVFLGKAPVTLHEPNALVLDMAEYALDNGMMQPVEELLRIDNVCRRQLGIPIRCTDVTQPYCIEDTVSTHILRLRFTIESEIDIERVCLAGEELDGVKVTFNGQAVPYEPNGWFTDKAIETLLLPAVKKGGNILEIQTPIGERTNLEWFYLLGDFGVRVQGTVCVLTAPVRELAFGSIVHQGLPFYTGNLTYHIRATSGDSGASLRVPAYRGALLRVAVDGVDKGAVIYSPYRLDLPGLSPGEHKIDITLYNTRQNAFGQLHHNHDRFFMQLPDSWRTIGDEWWYEYQLKDVGILKSPEWMTME